MVSVGVGLKLVWTRVCVRGTAKGIVDAKNRQGGLFGAAGAANSATSLALRGLLLDVPSHAIPANLAFVVVEWKRRTFHILRYPYLAGIHDHSDSSIIEAT